MTHEELIKRYNSYGMEERDKQLFIESQEGTFPDACIATN